MLSVACCLAAHLSPHLVSPHAHVQAHPALEFPVPEKEQERVPAAFRLSEPNRESPLGERRFCDLSRRSTLRAQPASRTLSHPHSQRLAQADSIRSHPTPQQSPSDSSPASWSAWSSSTLRCPPLQPRVQVRRLLDSDKQVTSLATPLLGPTHQRPPSARSILKSRVHLQAHRRS